MTDIFTITVQDDILEFTVVEYNGKKVVADFIPEVKKWCADRNIIYSMVINNKDTKVYLNSSEAHRALFKLTWGYWHG